MRTVLCSPGTYVQQEGAIKTLSAEYAAVSPSEGRNGAYIIVDSVIDGLYHDDIVSSFTSGSDDGQATHIKYKLVLFGGECSDAEIQKHVAQLEDADTVIGIGGGKTLDTAKAVGYYGKRQAIIVPTAASSDAPCSRLSVVYTDDGQFDHYLPLPQNPAMVLMDTDLISKAPARFLISGIGDAFATYYEAAACVQSSAITMTGGHATNAAFALATLCHDNLLADGVKAVSAVKAGLRTKAVENIIETNTLLSGLGFESCGLAAAHSIHDGLTALPETHSYLHGEKVAFGTLAQMIMEDRSLDELTEVYRFFRAVGLPTNFKGIGITDVSDQQLLQVGELACGPNDTMANMPFAVEPIDVAHALRAADALDSVIKD